MTQSTKNQPALAVEQLLPQPDPDATILIRLVTHSFAPGGSSSEPMAWVASQRHPLVAEATILRMYLREDGGVDVYWSDDKMFLRTFIPERAIVFFEEVMSAETFVAFIEQAESEEEEDPDEPGDPEPGSGQEAPPSTGGAGDLGPTGPTA